MPMVRNYQSYWDRRPQSSGEDGLNPSDDAMTDRGPNRNKRSAWVKDKVKEGRREAAESVAHSYQAQGDAANIEGARKRGSHPPLYQHFSPDMPRPKGT